MTNSNAKFPHQKLRNSKKIQMGFFKDWNLHNQCTEGKCLPLGEPPPVVQGLERPQEPSSRLVQQVNYDFYSKPSAPKTTILSCSANPWQQKRTAFTQEVIRRLL